VPQVAGAIAGRVPLTLLLMTPLILMGCAGAKPSLSVHPASAMVRIGGPSGVAEPPPAGKYEMEMARNESEAFQVQVRADCVRPDRPLRVRVEIEPVESCKSNARPRFRIFQVLDVHHTGPCEHKTFKVPTRNVGWIPDVCWPTRLAAAQEHNPGAVTFLFDIHAADDVTAGTWRYRIKFIEPDGTSAPASLDLTVHVRPFALPTRLPFKTAVTWNRGIEKYLGRKLTEEDRLSYLDFFCRHRFTPAAFWSVGPELSQKEIAFVLARGGNVFQIYGRGGRRPFTDRQKADLAPKLKAWRETMRRAGAEPSPPGKGRGFSPSAQTSRLRRPIVYGPASAGSPAVVSPSRRA